MAIISKKIFEQTCAGAGVGDVIGLSDYRSSHRALDVLTPTASLFLVTVRPPERLWLVAELTGLKKTATAWEGRTNTTPVRDVTDLVGELRLASGKGISARPGRLGMSLQTPRELTAADASLLRGSGEAPAPSAPRKPAAPKVAAPKKPPPPKKPAPAPGPAAPGTPPSGARPAPAAAGGPDRAELAAVLEGRMEVAISAVRDLGARATAETVELMLELGWVDLAKWRSTEATAFWVHSYLILMCLGQQRHIEALRRVPAHARYSVAHQQVLDGRLLTAHVIEQRGVMRHRGPAPQSSLPRARARLAAYLAERIGDRGWGQVDELLALVEKPRFALESFEGLAVYAALLLHASDEQLHSLGLLAARDPLLALVLRTRGLASREADRQADELLAQIYADPASDELRAVYADRLLELGDPRGELIQLQLGGQDPAIDDKTAVSWSGAIKGVLRWRAPFVAERPLYRPRYRRGFLSGCQVDALDGKLRDAPEWSTIEILDCEGPLARLADHDLRSLIALGALDGAGLAQLVDGAPELARRLVAVGLADELDEAALARLSTLPGLRLLVLGTRFGVEALARHPLADRLELLGVPPSARVPARLGGRIEVVRLGYGQGRGHCLPLYDRIILAAVG